MKRFISLLLIIAIIFSMLIIVQSDTGYDDNETEEKETGVINLIDDDTEPKPHQALEWSVGNKPSSAPIQAAIIGWNIIIGWDKEIEEKESGGIEVFIPTPPKHEAVDKTYEMPILNAYAGTNASAIRLSSVENYISSGDKDKFYELIEKGCTIKVDARIQKFKHSNGKYTPVKPEVFANSKTDIDKYFSEFTEKYKNITKSDDFDMFIDLDGEDVPVLEQDYSTLIIRTGTEGQPDSKPRANIQNEAVVEYRVTNSNKDTGIADIEFEIKNAKNITVEGLLEPEINGEKITGKLNMSELYAFGELQRHPEYIIYSEISLDRQRWQNKKDIKIREYTAGQKSYKDAKSNYGNMTQNEFGEDHIARAIRVKWTVKDANRPVTMISCMKPFDKEKNIENNKDIVIIQNDKYEFSCFNNYTITHDTIYKPGEPKNKCTFWMMQPIHADDEMEDEFLVLMRVERYQNGQEYTTIYEPDEPTYFKLNKDNPIATIDFIADNPRYILTIWRKGKELDEYKDNERFKNQYFMGYEKTYKGEKYYYYKFYHSYDHGFFYPTKLGLSYMREDKAREFIGRFGYTDFDKWNKAIK